MDAAPHLNPFYINMEMAFVDGEHCPSFKSIICEHGNSLVFHTNRRISHYVKRCIHNEIHEKCFANAETQKLLHLSQIKKKILL